MIAIMGLLLLTAGTVAVARADGHGRAKPIRSMTGWFLPVPPETRKRHAPSSLPRRLSAARGAGHGAECLPPRPGTRGRIQSAVLAIAARPLVLLGRHLPVA